MPNYTLLILFLVYVYGKRGKLLNERSDSMVLGSALGAPEDFARLFPRDCTFRGIDYVFAYASCSLSIESARGKNFNRTFLIRIRLWNSRDGKNVQSSVLFNFHHQGGRCETAEKSMNESTGDLLSHQTEKGRIESVLITPCGVKRTFLRMFAFNAGNCCNSQSDDVAFVEHSINWVNDNKNRLFGNVAVFSDDGVDVSETSSKDVDNTYFADDTVKVYGFGGCNGSMMIQTLACLGMMDGVVSLIGTLVINKSIVNNFFGERLKFKSSDPMDICDAAYNHALNEDLKTYNGKARGRQLKRIIHAHGDADPLIPMQLSIGGRIRRTLMKSVIGSFAHPVDNMVRWKNRMNYQRKIDSNTDIATVDSDTSVDSSAEIEMVRDRLTQMKFRDNKNFEKLTESLGGLREVYPIDAKGTWHSLVRYLESYKWPGKNNVIEVPDNSMRRVEARWSDKLLDDTVSLWVYEGGHVWFRGQQGSIEDILLRYAFFDYEEIFRDSNGDYRNDVRGIDVSLVQ